MHSLRIVLMGKDFELRLVSLIMRSRELADDVVLFDLGSHDDTIELAQKVDCRVVNYDGAVLMPPIAKADIVLKGGRVFDLITGNYLDGDVAICGDTIVGTCDNYKGKQIIDVTNSILVPGFIDTHLHIESSMVTPFEFERCDLPLGVTTAICDPHEIANVVGSEGVKYFQESSEQTIMDIFVQLSSCVPSTEMELSLIHI